MGKVTPPCEDNLIVVTTGLDYLRETDESVNQPLCFPYHIHIQEFFSISEAEDLSLLGKE